MRKEERRRKEENGRKTGKVERWQKRKLRESSGKKQIIGQIDLRQRVWADEVDNATEWSARFVTRWQMGDRL